MPETTAAKVRMVLLGLLAALGAWRLEPVIGVLLYRRIGGSIGRIERLLLRFRAGLLWRMPHRDAGSGRKMHGKPVARLPNRFGWLVLAARHHAVCFALQLEAVLNEPEMLELLAVSVQAQRILRPLCRALALELPGDVRKISSTADCAATVDAAPKPRKTKPRIRPEPFRIPLPRGVLTAARRQGFGKDR